MDSKYAITEIITTGLNFKLDRIIHLSSFVVKNGEIIAHLTTYINPERTLGYEFIKSTGILNDNIKFSPKFYEKAKDILTIWEGSILLSSNARLTTSFLKKEFKSLGFEFNMKHDQIPDSIANDTVENGRIEERAYAYTSAFLNLESYGEKHTNDFTPRALLLKEINLISNECGIYLLKNKNGTIIYVGKAIKIRTRLKQHFRNLSNKGYKIHRMVAAVDHILIRSELMALLLEQHHILTYKPELNKALRNQSYSYEMRYVQAKTGIDQLCIFPIEKSKIGCLIRRFRSRKSALSSTISYLLDFDLAIGHILFHGISNDKFIDHMPAGIILNSELSNDHLSDMVKIIHPFYKGKYCIQEISNEDSFALIEDGAFVGMSLAKKKGHNFEKLMKNIQYKFKSEYALNLILTYHHKGLLKITLY
ncbi:MAG: exonuclease domain-containing protein [Saprospiraceae bacterium]